MRRNQVVRVTAVGLACALLGLSTGMARADQLNGEDLVSTGDTTKVAGGAGEASFYLRPTGSDGSRSDNCNASTTSPVTVTVTSNQSWLTIASPGTVTLTACKSGSNLNAASIGYSVSNTATVGGVATISGTASGGTASNDGFGYNDASFTVTVAAAPDSTPPAISYSLTPAAPTGSNGWYTGNVALAWTVSEPQSPASLSKLGCVDQSVTADQAATTYSCSATSSGGSAGPVQVSIKRDATPPTVTLSGGPANGATYYENYDVPAAPTCGATDATSGVNGSCSVNGYSAGPGTHTVSASATDLAGNTGTSGAVTYTVLRDTTPPDIQGLLDPATADGSNAWYRSNVSLTWQVAEPETGGSLTRTGCENLNVTADQGETTYTCEASSLGGSAGPVARSIKRDATPPGVTLTGGPAGGATYYQGYDVPDSPTCGALDDTSGVNGSCSVSGYGDLAGTYTVSASATDFAGNTGTSASVTYTVREDTTSPVIGYTLTPSTPDGSDDWYRSSVSLVWSVADPETPGSVVIDDGCADQAVTADQGATTYRCSASSVGGSAGPVDVSIKRDATPPTVTRTGGPANGATYYEGYDVPAPPTCGATDATSGVAGSCSVSGYGDTEGTYTVSASATDRASNTGSSSAVTYTVLKDTSAPVIGHTVTPAGPNGDNGWYRSDVSLTWSVGESETPNSLSKTGCADQNVTMDQQATTYSCSASSVGGTAGPVDVSIKRDATPPTVTRTGGPADGTTYYEGYDVPAPPTCSATDATSGVAGSCSVSGYGDTEGTYTVSASATDQAGNTGSSSSVTYTVLKDTSAPVIAHTVTPSGPDGDNGWYRSIVSLTWSVTEAETPASLSKTGCAEQNVTADQAATTYSCSASSVGGTAGPVDVSIKRDATPPTVACPASQQFVLNAAGIVLTATVADATSGPAAATISAAADTSSVGAKSVTLTGYDLAGNSASASCPYSVGYAFVGYSSPVDNPGWINKLKAGQAIPLKWRLLDANGRPVTNLTTANLTVQSRTCADLGTTLDLLEETAAGSSGLQNLGNGYYQLNWKSPTSYANSCKALTLSIGEGAGRTHDAWFMFTK